MIVQRRNKPLLRLGRGLSRCQIHGIDHRLGDTNRLFDEVIVPARSHLGQCQALFKGILSAAVQGLYRHQRQASQGQGETGKHRQEQPAGQAEERHSQT